MTLWWENSFIRMKNNKLFLDGIQVETLAKKFGTPLYVYGLDLILNNFNSYKKLFKKHFNGKTRIYYALKANSSPLIVKKLAKAGAWFDAVSPQEAKLALKCGAKKEKILFTGTSVSNADLKALVKLGVMINIDSFSQMRRLAGLKPKNKKISIRWNPGFGAGLHSHTITAGKNVKFGIPEQKIVRAFKEAKELGFKITGLHQHIGSGWLGNEVDVFLKTVNKTIKVAEKCKKLHPEFEFIDFGGGPGIRYKKSDREFPLEKYVKGISSRIKSSGLDVEIAVEPGRSIVGTAGVLLAEVNTVEQKGVPTLGVNAGFNSLMRPALYSAYHEIVVCSNVNGKKKKRFMVAGNLCESTDVFNENKKQLRLLPVPKEGDIIALLCAGAYGFSMASNYNLREKPAEVVLSRSRTFLATKRQSFQGMVRLFK